MSADEGSVMRTVVVLGLLCALVSPAAGQGATPGQALVPYATVPANGLPTIPAPLTTKIGDAKAGQQVVIDRRLGNCLSCHEIGALRTEPFHGEIGPPLDGVAGRWDAASLRMILVNAKKVFGDGTAMPAFYRIDGLNRVRAEFAGKPILTAQQVEDVIAYLGTMK